ncbi:hypothetical protein GCM10009116_18480 [Brevundimonas basaltis]|uniref:Uncharacterized protein n=1 Tax=Brevundimonas basaltis TaxID=472166 RepID=A0A7W8HW91_9CAUL|nr:hypothetical protein [Brevundimonas basaltis]MBB5290844.1 hypothetical protein [Brevundimonas basaltis]
MGFAVQPIFTTTQAIWFAVLLTFGVAMQLAFSPRRRAIMGGLKFALASALAAAPAAAGVTLVRGAYRLGYLEEGRGFWEANLRSVVWMSGAIFFGQLAVRYLPPMAWLSRDLRNAGRAVWSERLGRWMGKQQ